MGTNHKVIENEIPKVVDVSRNTSSEIKAPEQKVEMDSKPVTATNSESKTSDFNMNNNSQNNNSGLSDGKYSGEYHVKNDSSINPSFDKALNNEQQLRSNINQRVEIIKDVQLNSVNSRIESLIASRESQSLTLKLNPASLGKIDIALEVIENTVKANIEVENEVVRQSVQANIDQLRQSLIQQGLQPQSLSVSLSNSEDRSNKYFKNKKRNQHDREVELENSLEQEAPKKMGYNTYDFVA